MIPKWFGPDHTASQCPGSRDWLVRFGLDSLRLHQLLRRSLAQRDLSHHGGIDTSRRHCEPHRRLRCSGHRMDQILLIPHSGACAVHPHSPSSIPSSCIAFDTRLRLGPHLEWHPRSEEHTSELQSLMRISYPVFCLKKKTKHTQTHTQY